VQTKQEDQLTDRLIEVFSSFSTERRNLIPLLQEVQKRLSYLPREAMLAIAHFFGIPEVEVYGVATFYNQFRLAPLGKHHIRVCMGTACHLAGGKLVLEALERDLDIKVGKTTQNREFSLERVACGGCGMRAPVVLIGEDVHPKMTPFKAEEALIPYRHEAYPRAQ
jgi:NADH-quinone oxidoreductase subunit E